MCNTYPNHELGKVSKFLVQKCYEFSNFVVSLLTDSLFGQSSPATQTDANMSCSGLGYKKFMFSHLAVNRCVKECAKNDTEILDLDENKTPKQLLFILLYCIPL